MPNVLEDFGKHTIEKLDYVGSVNIQWWATLRAIRSALPFVGNELPDVETVVQYVSEIVPRLAAAMELPVGRASPTPFSQLTPPE